MIGSSENRISYNGNGIATEFAYNFIIIEKSDIKVLHVAADGTEQLLTKDYYVDIEKSVVLYPGYAPGAEIPEQDRPPVLPVGERLVIYREVPITQDSALDKHWPFNVIENGLDKLTIICQQIWDRLQRSFYVSESTSTNFDTKVPIEAGKTFRVKDDGTGFEVTEDPGKVIDGATALLEQTTEQANIALASSATAQNAANLAEVQANSVKKYKALWFNNVASMKAEANLTAGAYVNTAGYYKPNDGGGASYLIREKQDSDIDDGGGLHELANGLVAELIIENGTVNVKQFGAKGDNSTNDTLAINNTIDYSYKNKLICFFPSGTYLVDNLGAENVNWDGFRLEGSKIFNSVIKLSSDKTKMITVTAGKNFQSVEFSHLQFIGNNNATFIDNVSIAVQSNIFNNVRWDYWHSIYKTDEINANGSEYTFIDCKIKHCGTTDNPCKLFVLKNDQAVNWRFYSTDIEQNYGDIFYLIYTAGINFYQGSIIPFSGTVIKIPKEADNNHFAGVCINFFGSRFELRNPSKLVEQNHYANQKISFYGCSMGGYNISDAELNVIDLQSSGVRLYFNSCIEFDNYKTFIRSNVDSGQVVSRIIMDECMLDVNKFMEKYSEEITGSSTYNAPVVKINGRQYNRLTIFKRDFEYRERVLLTNTGYQNIKIQTSANATFITVPIWSHLDSIIVKNKPYYGEGSSATYTVQVYDENETLLGELTHNINQQNSGVININSYHKNIKIKLFTNRTTDFYGPVFVTGKFLS